MLETEMMIIHHHQLMVVVVVNGDIKIWIERILSNLIDEILIFGGIGIVLICILCFILLKNAKRI